MIVRTLPRGLSPGLYAQRGQQILDTVGFLRGLVTDPTIPPPARTLERTQAKLHIINADTGEDVEAFFNPVELTRALQVEYKEPEVIGLPHRPQHYSGTGNQEVRFLIQFLETRSSGRELMRDQMRFLESLCYPGSVGGHMTAPPLVVLLWPGILSLVGDIREWEEVTNRFAWDTLEPVGATVSLTFKEFRRTALTHEKVREKGGLRG